MTTTTDGPRALSDDHRPPVRIGPEPERASVVVIAVHGRHQSAGYLVEHLVDRIDRPDVCWVLPRAAHRQWYEGRVHDPIETNEAQLAAAMRSILSAVPPLPNARVVWVGFSQGGCVVAEIMARVAGPWAGAAILSGALLGPDPGTRRPLHRLDGLRMEVATGDADPWMALQSAEATAEVFRTMGAEVTLTVTASGDHVIHDADIAAVTSLLDANTP